MAVKATRRIDPERRFHFLKDKELVKIYKEIEGGKMLKQLGYGGLI